MPPFHHAAPALALLLAVTPLIAQTAFDHSAFDRLLHEHVKHGLVDDEAFRHAPDFPA